MSTFSGRMEEINYISIDRFNNENLKSHAFFLSHCHTDHMKGIDSIDFKNALEINKAYLYMSSVSKIILENMYPHLSSKIKVLDASTKNLIEVPNVNKILTVIIIPAGHCPGSVMFLFEGDIILLYTGDIRIRAKEIRQFKHLYDSTGCLKQIDNIYLDTTFFLKSYVNFPLRKDSITKFCQIINHWLQKNEKNYIFIDTPANYGSEYLFTEVFKRCKLPIHVTQEKYDVYKHFPEMDNAIILDGSKTRIHNKCTGKYQMCNGTFWGDKFRLNIKPCCRRWKYYDFSKEIVEQQNNMIYICYSSHNSYTEIMDILKLLKPLKITPCVESKEEEDKNEMLNCVQDALEKIHVCNTSKNKQLFQNKLSWSNDDNITPKCTLEVDNKNKDIFEILDSLETKRLKLE